MSTVKDIIDVEGLITVEQVADDLSALADALIDCTLRWAWMRLKNRHRETHRLAVVAYGKLGGKELGYASDLDIIFLYEDDDERAPENYARLAQRYNNWLTLRTAAGTIEVKDLQEVNRYLVRDAEAALADVDQAETLPASDSDTIMPRSD